MLYTKRVQTVALKVLKEQGTDGEVVRVKSRAIAGVNSVQNMNSYDENGNESTLTTGVNSSPVLQRLKFKYGMKQLRGYEKSPASLNSGQVRITCISQDLKKADYLKNKVLKGDEFYDSFGTKYSIDEVHHVGQMQSVEVFLELICSRV